MKKEKKQVNKGDVKKEEEKNETRIEGEKPEKTDEKTKREDQARTKINKSLFLQNFVEQKGVIERVCLKIGIHKSTYYDWMENDKDFGKRLNDLQKRYNDEAEDVLRNLVFVKRDPGSVKFYLQSKHPDYARKLKTEIVASGNKTAKEMLDEFDKELEEYEKENKQIRNKKDTKNTKREVGVSLQDKRQEGEASAIHTQQSTKLLLEEKDEKKSDSESETKGNIKSNRRRPTPRVHSERY